jgi:membrane-bound lytic murein transglycosylase B
MPTRRSVLAAALPATLAARAATASPTSFAEFLAGLRSEAARAGITPATIDIALRGIVPDPKVLERDRHQPEFTLTWAQYRALLITDKRIEAGRAAVAQNRALLAAVQDRFTVPPGVITGIWGLESSFGTQTGDFHVVDALATLAWDGRRAGFFRSELIAALRILDEHDITPSRMTGSYAGAMGQPQFMPSSFLRYAVDFDGDGRRNIWTSRPDVLGSIANYLEQSGWHGDATWGQPVILPARFDPSSAGRETSRPLGEWAHEGVRPTAGVWRETAATPASVLIPDGPGGDAFVVYPHFLAIRRYNPSDFYALAVGLLGDRVTT